eukprot:TRINITY_DN1365_c0_g1_i4.p2 TRINITY_DN1365_c0_g1~~TRINITY_DN1365_c0_g1_i4.p2  ORF type:complete len:302 (+),score=45.04 TRINITY_DN1365_c0_g1_i4:10-915(+)
MVFCLDGYILFFFQAEDGIRDHAQSRGLGDVYKRQVHGGSKIINSLCVCFSFTQKKEEKMNHLAKVFRMSRAVSRVKQLTQSRVAYMSRKKDENDLYAISQYENTDPIREGQGDNYATFVHKKRMIPLQERADHDARFLDRNEIEARIMKVLTHFDKVNLKKFKWEDQMDSDLRLDSLEQTALLVAIEHEFHIVFEDRVFENFSNLDQVVRFINSDHYAFQNSGYNISQALVCQNKEKTVTCKEKTRRKCLIFRLLAFLSLYSESPFCMIEAVLFGRQCHVKVCFQVYPRITNFPQYLKVL